MNSHPGPLRARPLKPPRSACPLSFSAPAPLGNLTALPPTLFGQLERGGNDWLAIDPLRCPLPQMGGHIPEATSEELATHGAVCPTGGTTQTLHSPR